MLKGLLQFVLSVVTWIANILFTPIFEALNAIIPRFWSIY